MEEVLIIGGSGALGNQLMKNFSNICNVNGTYYQNKKNSLRKLDITNKRSVAEVMNKSNYDLVILTSAMTNVEKCETHPEIARKINVEGVKNVVEHCGNRKFVFYSTDAIFDGTKRNYIEKDRPNPLNVYGETKLEAEEIVKGLENYLICRTSRLYGPGSNKFLNNIITKLEKKEKINVPTNTPGNPSYIPNVSHATIELVKKNKKGIYHVCGKDAHSLDEMAIAIAEIFGFDKKLITKVEKNYFNSKVNRANVVMNIGKLLSEDINMNNFNQGLQMFKKKEGIIK